METTSKNYTTNIAKKSKKEPGSWHKRHGDTLKYLALHIATSMYLRDDEGVVLTSNPNLAKKFNTQSDCEQWINIVGYKNVCIATGKLINEEKKYRLFSERTGQYLTDKGHEMYDSEEEVNVMEFKSIEQAYNWVYEAGYMNYKIKRV